MSLPHKMLWALLFCTLAAAQTCNQECSLVLGAVNQERARVGLKPVCINSMLMRAATVQAVYQNSIHKMTHDGAGGSSVGDRATAQGYRWTQIAENVAMGQTTAKSVMLGWMNSAGHRKNILNPAVTEMGISHVDEFWAQAFGLPRDGTGRCDVGVPGGNQGMAEPATPDVGPPCDSFCQSVLQVVNSKHSRPLCTNAKLMAAAQKLAQAKSIRNLQVVVDDTGFGTKGVWAAEHTISLSRGLPSDRTILDVLRKNFRGGTSKDYSHVGIASDSRREYWVIIEAATYTPDEDRCQTPGSSSSSSPALPPPQSPQSPQRPVMQIQPLDDNDSNSDCAKITSPCQCLDKCGWSTSSRSCKPASQSTFTDCRECSTQAGCRSS